MRKWESGSAKEKGDCAIDQEQVQIKTPEYVSLQFTAAGLGSRAAALIIDHLILLAVNLLIGLLLFFINQVQGGGLFNQLSSVTFSIAIVLIFVLNWGYFFALEYFYGGKTIGKKILGIRAIQENGHSLTLLSSFIRNLVRIIDMLPASYLVGMVMIFFHPIHKRLGDVVAGTIVVHERKVKKDHSAVNKEMANRNLDQSDLEIDDWALRSFGKEEWKLLETYSHRFLQLGAEERFQLTRQLAAILLPKAGVSTEDKTTGEMENSLLVLYLILRDEWEYEL